MPKLTVDGMEVEVPQGATVLQACEAAGAEIPRFCYHERLSIAGNCRMCLVEMERSPKPIASCAMPAGDNMVIHTNTETVKKAREGVMEFLLINHPLDCPICDQGGECDLQDQAMAYGRGGSRFEENKRAVSEKYMGPLIKTIMTRCIHCTRCIRFVEEVAGVPEIGAIFRGEDMEITALEQVVDSELSGNVIDLCPVGALTSRPYAFEARPWELRKTETIDVMDALGSNIRVDARGREVMRVLPRLNDDVNEEWISDKTRYACDGLRRQRLDRPYVRRDGRLKPASWEEAFQAIAARLDGVSGDRIGAIAGDLAGAEEMMALKDLMNALGSGNVDCRQDGGRVGGGARGDYLFNSTIAGIEDADAILLVGTNPRKEAAVLNARIRKAWVQSAGTLKIGVIGEQADLTYPYEYLGAGPQTLTELAGGGIGFPEVLKGAERPMIILGAGAVAREDGLAIHAAARRVADMAGAVADDWNGFNMLHNAASRVAGLELGLVPGEGGRDTTAILDGAAVGEVEVVYLLGADEVDFSKLEKAFVIYQGSHGDAGAHAADVILPGAAYTEKSAIYINTEGRVQRTDFAVHPPGEAREDWKVLRALSGELGRTLPYDDLEGVRSRMKEIVEGIDMPDVPRPGALGEAGGGEPGDAPFRPVVGDYYLTNPIARASETMAKCSALYSVGGGGAEATGTDG
ncbi:NADH-quinone oxidoreductase subunit NuoG [Minwuia thermotolerans]|uniref:NADH-quinone oxidoreductase n=1 Tax=Minwuia thermotolerans TaxID=2056226 RepID=A0A2M9G1Q2_9PROT|nr:NADH-quinone oxidoreductase subunit NuoG [Minwuia thermotolerans]PJK29648.1 NADH-quinone oxidoreductase subunit G [Minwuia thermotolerans]